RRLQNFFNFSQDRISTYALSKTPLDSAWGPPPFSHILYDPAAIRPVKIWVVGTVLELTCVVSVGPTQSRTRLKMQLLRSVDADVADRLSNMGRRRVRFGYDLFEASRSENPANGCEKMFRDVFDARWGFQNKNQMQRIPPSDIIGGDLVLAECLYVKSRQRRPAEDTYATDWNSSFSLLAIALLAKAPRTLNLHVTATRRVSGYYYAAGHELRPVAIPMQRFNFDCGVEQPLLDGILHGADRVTRYVLRPTGSDVSYTAYVASKATTGRGDRAYRRAYGALAWDGDMVVLRHAKYTRTYVNARKDDRRRAEAVIQHFLSPTVQLDISSRRTIRQRHVCMTVTVRVTESDAVFVEFTWQQFRSNAPRFPYQHYASVDAPRRTNTELYVPNDPFARPMILFTTRRSFYGVPGEVFLNAEVSQLPQRNVYRTQPLQLTIPNTATGPEDQPHVQETTAPQQDGSSSSTSSD
ncbi:hypothetical protein OH77DRAFT_1402666, partial [Trametes cingulata]